MSVKNHKMTNNGLSKLTEELGELIQIVGKLLQYDELQEEVKQGRKAVHGDGKDLGIRLIEEMADVYAAMEFVEDKLNLESGAITDRAKQKLARYKQWDKQ